MSQHLCVSGSSARSMSLGSCLSIHVYLRILCKSHVSGSISQQPYVSQDPLQDPRLRIHVSASLYLTDSLQDPRLRIHDSAFLYLRILCKIHVSGSMCPIHVLASTNMDPLQDPCLRSHVSASLRLMILYKIHVFGFMSQHLCISGSSTRSTSSDSCLSIFVSHGFSARPMSPDPCRSIHLYLTILCKIHVSGFMSQHLCISGFSTRSMSSDSCLSIFVSQDPLQDPCLRVMSQMYLRILCKIHVSGSMSQHPFLRILCKIHVSGVMSQHPYVSQDPLQDPYLWIRK